MRSSLVVFALLAAGPATAREPTLTPAQATVAALPATGPARTCVNLRDVQETKPAGPRAILFRLGANRWLRNDLPSICPANRDRILVIKSTIGQLCRGDIVGVTDPVSRIGYGSCVMGNYTPVDLPKGLRL